MGDPVVGVLVGFSVVGAVGDLEGEGVGAFVGEVGLGVGDTVGSGVGLDVGSVGADVTRGFAVGAVGALVGLSVGDVGAGDG